MKIKFHTLDVFTTQKFAGNPLAVCLDTDGLNTKQMQTIAAEFNLPETTFIMRPEHAANTAKMHIFTPKRELPFAGHPTVGSAILLADLLGLNEIRFELQAGLTPVKIQRGKTELVATLTAPALPFACDVPLPSVTETANALSLLPEDIGCANHLITALEGGPRFFFVPLKNREALARSRINLPAWNDLLAKLNSKSATAPQIFGAYLYTKGGLPEQTHFSARMYAPSGGIPEDPATGSATVLLAAQLLKTENLKDGTHEWRFEQGTDMGRPSQLHLEADIEFGKLKGVRLSGGAVKVSEGYLTL